MTISIDQNGNASVKRNIIDQAHLDTLLQTYT